MEIKLPNKINSGPILIEFTKLVVIGANGSGKTRFGADIEKRYSNTSHRISAQKSLSLPKRVGTKSLEVARSEFLYGAYMDIDPEHYKKKEWKSRRWNDNLNTSLLNDYEKLMVLLHTEEFEAALEFKKGRSKNSRTKLDVIQSIWEKLLPHRKLSVNAGVVNVTTSSGIDTYNGSEMSDGERVIFYLIGEAICAPDNSVIIFDEPEMHIHKSIVKKLFDLIEAERLDCSFIYLTHDIDFAFMRNGAKKVWAKSYEGNQKWDYEVLDESFPIPEQLYLDVLGSRKSIIFLEGDSSSLDYKLYEYLFPEYTIKAVGSCEKVIHLVKSFNDQYSFHHIKSVGLIDRDRRESEQIKRLTDKDIWILDVAEAENLLLLQDVVIILAKHMGKENTEAIFEQIKNNLKVFFEEQLESQILLHFKQQLIHSFTCLSNFSSKNILDAIKEIEDNYIKIDKGQIFKSIKDNFEEIIANDDYNAILRVFNLKNALVPKSGVCELLGIKNQSEYLQLLISKLKRNDNDAIFLKEAIINKIIK